MRSTYRSAALGAALCAFLLPAAGYAQLKAPKTAPAKTEPAKPQAETPAAESTKPAAEPAQDPELVEKETAGALAAQGWLTLLDRRDWGTAWETAAGMFHSSVPLGTWMDGIPKVRGDLGNLVERAPAVAEYKNQLPGRPVGDYVTTIFDSRFEQRQVEEVVTTVREPDGKWRVTGYSTR